MTEEQPAIHAYESALSSHLTPEDLGVIVHQVVR